MHGIFVGFAAQPGEITLLNLPLPAYATGPWVIAVGCDGCTFRVGLNITRCGDGWAGFPSSALQLSPALTGLHSPAEALELAGQNFTCVPVITAKVSRAAPVLQPFAYTCCFSGTMACLHLDFIRRNKMPQVPYTLSKVQWVSVCVISSVSVCFSVVHCKCNTLNVAL